MILVMEDGSVVEQGTHAELVEKRGTYAALISAQVDPLGQVVDTAFDSILQEDERSQEDD